jgi:hypothetical protein
LSGKEDASGIQDMGDTLRPMRSSPMAGTPVAPAKLVLSSRLTSSSNVEDYSDIAFDDDESGLEAKMASLKVRPILRFLRCGFIRLIISAQKSISERHSSPKRYSKDEGSCPSCSAHQQGNNPSDSTFTHIYPFFACFAIF